MFLRAGSLLMVTGVNCAAAVREHRLGRSLHVEGPGH
jgi:hypothetical protein